MMWVEHWWNPKMREFAISESQRHGERVSFSDLVIGQEKLSQFLLQVARARSTWERLSSGHEILEGIKDIFTRTLLQMDMKGGAKERLEELFRQRAPDRRQFLERLTGKQFFYFWLCEARQAVAHKPNLPLALGELFGDGADQVRDHVQAARRALRGE